MLYLPLQAEVVELADALDSKSSSGNRVWVQVPPSAPYRGEPLGSPRFCFIKSRLYRTVPFLLEKGLYPAGYLLIYTLTAALACYQSTVGRLFLPMICKLSLDAIRIRAFLCPDRKRALQAFANLTFAIAYYDHL